MKNLLTLSFFVVAGVAGYFQQPPALTRGAADRLYDPIGIARGPYQSVARGNDLGGGRWQDTSGGGRTYVVRMYAPAAISNPRLVYGNYYAGSYGETPNTNDLPIRASIALSAPSGNPARYVATFRGVRDLTIPGATTVSATTGNQVAPLVESDPVGVYIPAGTYFWVYTYVNPGLNLYAPVGENTFGTAGVTGEGPGTGDITDTGGPSSTDTSAYGPVAVLGNSLAVRSSIFVGGDSIARATGDVNTDLGFICRALGIDYNGGGTPLLPYCKGARGGELLSNFQGIRRYARMQLAGRCTHAVLNYGTNSVGAGVSLATMQAQVREIVAALRQLGLRVYWCTLPPRTASTDGWRTVEGQSYYTNEAQEVVRVGFNNWLRSFWQSIGLSGLFETADTVETSRNSGKWRVQSQTFQTATATSGASASLTLTGAGWSTNQHRGRRLVITGGTGAGQARTITSNTATVLSVNSTWSANPDNTSVFAIDDGPVIDGIHPSAPGHIAMSGAIRLSSLLSLTP